MCILRRATKLLEANKSYLHNMQSLIFKWEVPHDLWLDVFVKAGNFEPKISTKIALLFLAVRPTV